MLQCCTIILLFLPRCILIMPTMKKQRLWPEELKTALLLFIPLFYLAAGLYFRLILDDPSLRSVDPDYVYFCTGLNMAEGHFKVAHIDHPGTPLQVLTALVFRLVWWFRGEGSGFTDDILRNPDLYLQMVNLAINLILAGALLAAGRAVYRKTSSLTGALVIQSIPLLPFILYEIIGRISPEQILALPIIALTVFLIGKSQSGLQQFTNREILLLALITGFGLSIKLTLLPLLLFPLVIVPGWKKKATAISLSLLFFFLLAFPATLQIERFWHWIRDLFLYSGQYGSGEKNVVNLVQLRQNFSQMAGLQPHFTAVFILTVATSVYGLLRYRRHNPLKYGRAVMATTVLAAILLHALMAGKQYAPRYIMPAMMYGPLLIFLLGTFISDLIPAKPLRWGVSLAILLFVGWTLHAQVDVIRYTSEAFKNQIAARKMTREHIATLEPGSLRIIATGDYGSPFPEYALRFFTAWAPQSLKARYNDHLAQLYPKTALFNPIDGQLTLWGEEWNPEEIRSSGQPVYLYLEKDNDALYNQTLAKLMENQASVTVEKELLFANPVNGEALYRLHITPETSTTPSGNNE